jgi:hypothetical protein
VDSRPSAMPLMFLKHIEMEFLGIYWLIYTLLQQGLYFICAFFILVLLLILILKLTYNLIKTLYIEILVLNQKYLNKMIKNLYFYFIKGKRIKS